MTNEELATQIQQDRSDLIPVLWNQVERLVHWKAKRVSRAVHPDNSYAAADLEQDLYQSGYIAMTSAVKTFIPDSEYHFSTWFMFHLKTEFADVTGLKTVHQRRDPARWALSLDAPINHDDGNETDWRELTPDHQAEAQLQAVDEKVFQEQLRSTVARTLSAMPDDQQQVLRMRFWEGLTYQKAAEVLGYEYRDQVRQVENKAIRSLREPVRAKLLKSYVDYDFYCGTGLQAWKSSGMSIQEKYLIKLESKRSRQA